MDINAKSKNLNHSLYQSDKTELFIQKGQGCQVDIPPPEQESLEQLVLHSGNKALQNMAYVFRRQSNENNLQLAPEGRRKLLVHSDYRDYERKVLAVLGHNWRGLAHGLKRHVRQLLKPFRKSTGLLNRLLSTSARITATACLMVLLSNGYYADASSQLNNRSDPRQLISPPVVKQESLGREVIFIDASLPDIDLLLSDAQEEASVVIIKTSENLIDQILNHLLSSGPVESLHLFTHGAPGQLQVGTTIINQGTLRQQARQLEIIGTLLTGSRDIYLYGCQVAAGNEGNDFIHLFSSITMADVAASDDFTGSADKGGDWELEMVTGEVNSRAIESYDYLALLAPGRVIAGDQGGAGGRGANTHVDYRPMGGAGGAGGGGNDTITGTSGDDILFGDGSGGGGGAGSYSIIAPGGQGGSGNDTINGGSGNDLLFGDGFDGIKKNGGFGGGGGGGGSSYGNGGNGGIGAGGGGGGMLGNGGDGGFGGGGGGSNGSGGGFNASDAHGVGDGGGGGGGGGYPGGIGGEGGTTPSNNNRSDGGNGGFGIFTTGGGNGGNGEDWWYGGGGGGGGFGGGIGNSEGGSGSAGGTSQVTLIDDKIQTIYKSIKAEVQTLPSLLGGAGNDILDGGPGSDDLFGMGGTNAFVFDSDDAITGNDVDTIYDWSNGSANKIILKTGGITLSHAKLSAIVAAQTRVGADRTIVLTDRANQVFVVVKGIGRDLTVSADEAVIIAAKGKSVSTWLNLLLGD